MKLKTLLIGVVLFTATATRSATAQDFATKSAEIQKKANALIEDGNKIFPAKVAEGLPKAAESKGINEDALRAYLRASGLFDPKYDTKQVASVPDLFGFPKKEQPLIAGKYLLAEQALAWRAVDPKFEYFISPRETDAVVIKLRRTQLESAIEALKYAEKRPLFSGQKYAASGSDVVDELTAVLKRLPK